jgi:uncharacterized lipoprotein YddW (UPF0748 family)
MRKRTLILLLFVALYFAGATSQTTSPKREMRATWLTTVWRLDWPSVTVPAPTGTNEASRQSAINSQKAGLISILDKLQEANMNATFMQIRSMCDAMYPSTYEPWSSFISAQRGDNPGWDPLAFAIEEAHKRGIELHAWINPYRYSSSSATHGNLTTDYANTNPGWLLDYGSSVKILNPGIPEVRKRITDIVKEIATMYKDLDGIVFDDYFYVNGQTTDAMDQQQFNLYNPDNLSRADWRRQNVNKMVKDVYDAIQAINPAIRFGISPAGVAGTSQAVANKYGVPRCPIGSDWQYNGIYADPLAWLSEGTIDYISPQVYWTIGSTTDYQPITQWWSYVAPFFNRHVYISHSLSAMSAGAPPQGAPLQIRNESIESSGISGIERTAFERQLSGNVARVPQATDWTATEIGAQIAVNRTNDVNDAPGSVFYATSKTVNTSGFITYLKNNVFTSKALLPSVGWKNSKSPVLVEEVTLNGSILSWNNAGTGIKYGVYATPKSAGISSVHRTASLLGMSYTNNFTLPGTIADATHYIGVTTIDGYENESAIRLLNQPLQPAEQVVVTYPVHNAQALLPTFIRWNTVEGAYVYQVQLAYDEQFNNLLTTRETEQPEFNTGKLLKIKTDTPYFLRVRALKANAPYPWSSTVRFTSKIFGILTPANQSIQQDMMLTISWDTAGPGATYIVDIATDALFSSSKMIHSKILTNVSSYSPPEGTLTPSTTYFVRVKVTDGSLSATSATVQFTTRDLDIPVPTLISPDNNASVYGNSIKVCWQTQPSKGFRAELSKDPAFPSRGTTLKNVDAFTYCTQFDNLTPDTYYLRVRAIRAEDLSEPSVAVKVLLSPATSLEDVKLSPYRCYLTGSGASERKLQIYSMHADKVRVSLFSVTGIMQGSEEVNLSEGENTIQKLKWPTGSGIWIVTINNQEKMYSFKIIH